MTLEKLLNNVNVLAVVCNQWGDTGKGKFVDFFGEWADIIVRGTGGANAGHTICLNDKQYIFHLIPSGIIHDANGKYNVIGNGVAFDPAIVKDEMEILKNNNMSCDNLRIAYNAKLVMPQHIVMDRVKEASTSKGKIGTTGRGIGPVYADFYSRTGLFVNDMLNKDIFVKRLRKNLEEKIKLLNEYDLEIIKEVFNQPILGKGKYYQRNDYFNVDAIVETYMEFGKLFKDIISNTDRFIRESLCSKNILLEGAQGHLLSIDCGTYPYVTSSDCSLPGLAKGSGLSEIDVDITLGIVKAFYMTRVGGGPFPTEFGRAESEEYCADGENNKKKEKETFPNLSVNESDEFKRGIAVRQLGSEYGATTGRPRRTGWLDLPLIRYAAETNGPNIILTKVDVLTGADTIEICDKYTYEGPDFHIGNEVFLSSAVIHNLPTVDSEFLKYCKPHYVQFPGWKEPIDGIREYADLPKEVKKIISYIENHTETNVRIVSVGPDRKQTIFK